MKKIVHIGQMKSGTTYLQNACSASREKLYKKGIFYPGPSFNHQHACYGICGNNIPWINKVKPLWASLGDDLIKQLNSQECTSLISCEALSCLSKDGVADFVKKIGGIDEVIVTVRNFHSTLLSAWQQSVKGGGANSLSEFFERLKSTRKDESGLWRNYAFGSIVENWAPHARVTILVMSGRGVLENFFKIMGVDGVFYDEENARSGNLSLMREDVELLRIFNKLNADMNKEHREFYVRYLLNKYFFPAASKSQGNKIALPQEYIEFVKMWCGEEILKLENLPNASVIGDKFAISKILDDKVAYDLDDFSTDPCRRLEFHARAVDA